MARIVRRSHRGEVFWREAVGRQAGSGLSMTEFCRRESIPVSTFSYWRVKLASTELTPRLLPVEVVGSAPTSAIEVALPTGHVLRVPCGFDETSLRVLLHVLTSASC